MPNYNFDNLSSNEFENLTRDLLQEEFGIRLESFKSGRDQGIDLRYAPSKDNSLIIQCKHYVGSGVKRLLSDLEKSESSKVKKLSPKRYIVVTSVGLSPLNKEKIANLFPACTSTEDIYGKDDLNNLLALYPNVERNHYKLWLSSVHVLESILKNAVISRTHSNLKHIYDKAKFYVQNVSFTVAKEILDKNNYCIIAGIPGIGKTTLAEALFIDHIRQGYEPVRVYGSIGEAFEMFKQDVKQVFYFDDFLGATSFDENSLERNEDKQLLDFLHSIYNSDGAKKLILTSRDYILKQAKQSFESINSTDIKPNLCIIDLQNYTRWNRAQILYNHLYFSDLSRQNITDLLKDRQYLRIIDHPYYSPRVIDLMTQTSNQWAETEDDFAVAFRNALDNPEKIWKYAFNRHISLSARYILWVMVSLPDRVRMEDLELAFRPFQQSMADYFNHSIDEMDFHDGLEEIEGTFIDIELLIGKVRIIRFHNPSIRDFLEDHLSEYEVVTRFLASSAQFFSQLRWLWGKYEIRIQRSKQLRQIRPRYRAYLLKYSDDFLNGLSRTLYSEDNLHYRRKTYRLADRVFLLREVSSLLSNLVLDDLITDAIQALKINATQGNETSFDLMKLVKNVNRSPYFNDVKDAFLASLNSASDFERYLIFKAHYSDHLTPRDEEIVKQRLNNLYPEKDLSYIEDLIVHGETIGDFDGNDNEDWFNDESNRQKKKSKSIDVNERIVDLFDSLRD